MNPEQKFMRDISNLDFSEVIEAVENLASKLEYKGEEKIAETNVRISIFMYAMDEYFKLAPAKIEEAVFLSFEVGDTITRRFQKTAERKFGQEKIALEIIRQMLR